MYIHVYIFTDTYIYIYIYICIYIYVYLHSERERERSKKRQTDRERDTYRCKSFDVRFNPSKRWRRLIGSLKLQVIFCKRVTNYTALLRKTTSENKASYDLTPPCGSISSEMSVLSSQMSAHMIGTNTNVDVHTDLYIFPTSSVPATCEGET